MKTAAASIYCICLLLVVVLRRRFVGKGGRTVCVRATEPWGVRLGMGLWGVSQLCALVWLFTPWLSFFDYPLPGWVAGLGAILLISGLALLLTAHRELGAQWSAQVDLQDGHRLISTGVYSVIRHPLYAGHWLWSLGQALLVQNWLGGLLAIPGMALLYAGRVHVEERLLLEHFGEEYRRYMQRTGRIMPRLCRAGIRP